MSDQRRANKTHLIIERIVAGDKTGTHITVIYVRDRGYIKMCLSEPVVRDTPSFELDNDFHADRKLFNRQSCLKVHFLFISLL